MVVALKLLFEKQKNDEYYVRAHFAKRIENSSRKALNNIDIHIGLRVCTFLLKIFTFLLKDGSFKQ
jgi:hypothetical protein